MTTRNAVIGTDASGDDPRTLLLQAGIAGMQAKAGYVPSVAPESECSLPEFTFVTSNIATAYDEYNGEPEYDNCYIVLDCSLCYSCRNGLNGMHPTIYFWWENESAKDTCEICGADLRPAYNDDIPF